MKRFSVLFLFSLILASCASALPKPTDLLLKEVGVVPSELQKEEVKRDVDILVYALRNGYSGAKHMPPEPFGQLVERLEKISRLGGMKRKVFCEEVGRVLEMAPDNHLRVTSGCAARQDSDLVKAPIGKNIATKTSAPFFMKKEKLGKRSVGVIGVSSLPSHKEEVWNGFAERAARLINSSDALIIDFRGNSGGDDTKALQLASLLYGSEAPDPRIIFQRKTPESLALQKNAYLASKAEFERKGKAVPSYVQENIKEIENEFILAEKHEIPAEKIYEKSAVREFNEERAFKGQIYILQDGGCASSCDSFLEAMEAHPKAVTVGLSSGGFVHFGEVAPLQLPFSKIRIQISTKFFQYPDGRFVEKAGYSPKIKYSGPENGIEFVKELLEQKH